MTATRQTLHQRIDYTQKHNRRIGRHGWLRLTPAYSVKIVDELIEKYDRPLRILDPFCGTATTVLSAAYHGHEGMTTDINPFLVWFGQAKTARYSLEVIQSARDMGANILKLIANRKVEPVAPPPIHHIERWWSKSELEFLCQLRGAIDTASQPDTSERTLLLVAFCRTLIALSKASFNHQSMSFKETHQLSLAFDFDMGNQYGEDLHFVLTGAAENPEGHGTVHLGDARYPAQTSPGLFDRVITSPPYANRMSYVRELRPYMYWLDFLTNGRDAGELDWLSIGGTWGIATSRLNEWKPNSDHFEDTTLNQILENIANHNNKNGGLLANYIAKYMDDLWLHFHNLRAVLAPGAETHYIVGNSTFYNVLLPVEQIYAAMLARLGFQQITCRPLRKRNSKKELIEFDVTAVWNG